MDIEFSEIMLQRGNKRVEWEWIGEGLDGDYDPNDPEDIPLLRFSCSEFNTPEEGDIDDGWKQMDDASYCTRMPVTSSLHDLTKAAVIILEAIEDCCYKKRLEELSWLCTEDFSKTA